MEIFVDISPCASMEKIRKGGKRYDGEDIVIYKCLRMGTINSKNTMVALLLCVMEQRNDENKEAVLLCRCPIV